MKRNFTLTELLVVIAIIGVLAAMTMPALSFARAAGQRTNCINNKSNVIKAMQIYANKNDDMIPFKLAGKSYAYILVGDAYSQVAGSSRPTTWKFNTAYLQPALLTCTVANVNYNDGDESTGRINNAFGMLNVIEDTWTDKWKGKTGTNDPTIRKQFGRFVVGSGDNVSYMMGRVKNASLLPMFVDSFKEMEDGDSKPVSIWNFKLWTSVADADKGKIGMPGMIHGDQTTAAYADGSARAVSARELASESGLRYTLNEELEVLLTNGSPD